MRQRLQKTIRRPAAVGVSAWIGFFLLSLAWVFATPLSGSPDEASHIIKAAAVVRGEFIGDATDDPSVKSVRVPADLALAQNWHCFAFKPSVSAACAPEYGDADELQPALTSAALYNPAFYVIVGWPTLLPIGAEATVYLMRVVNAALASAFLAVAVALLARLGRPGATLLGVVAAATPMVFFLNASVNPNAIEVSAGALTVAAIYTVTRRSVPRVHLWWILGAAAVAAAVMVNVRSIAALWLALFLLVVVVTSSRVRLAELLRSSATWMYVGVVGLATIASGAWILSTNTLGNMGTFPGAGTVTPVRGFITMLFDRSFDAGLVGIFGWLDTSAPNFAYVLWSFFGFATVLLAAAVARGRQLLALLAFAAVFLIVPPLVQAASVMNSGYIWQGRYTLVALVALLAFASAILSDAPRGLLVVADAPARRLIWMISGLFVFAHASTLLVATRRYMLGAEANWIDTLVHPQWVPPLGAVPWVVCAALGAAVVVASPFLGRRLADDREHLLRIPA